MESSLTRMGRRIAEVIQQEVQNLVNSLLKESFNPDVMLRLLKSMGMDISQLPGMIGQQPGIDPYSILGLDKSAKDEEVKERYRLLVNKLHPDTSGTEGTSFLFKMVLAAYELIKKERKW